MKRFIPAMMVAVLAAACADGPTSPALDQGVAPDGPMMTVVVDPLDPNTVTYTFDDLAIDCQFNATLDPTYEDLVFATTPYLATCQGLGAGANGTIELLPSNQQSGIDGVAYEVLIDLPSAASFASIESYEFQDPVLVTLNAYNADGLLVSTDAAFGQGADRQTLTVEGSGIVRLGLEAARPAANLFDNLTVTFDSGPTTADDCKKGGWADFGFSNQGQCVRFVQTGKDSR